MGNISNPEMLVARWAELVNDSSLHDLPYKIELNAQGTIEMSAVETGMPRSEAVLHACAATGCRTEGS